MGCLISNTADPDVDVAATETSKQIDRKLKEEQDNVYTKIIRVLLLGAGESGKSTIVKQLRIIYENGFTDEDCLEYKSVIISNTIQSIYTIVKAMDKLHISFSSTANQESARKMCSIISTMSGEHERHLTTELLALIKILWEDAGVQECFHRSAEYQLNDSSDYYLNSLDRLADPHYIPTKQDVLRTRVKTTGIVELSFPYKEKIFQIVDVGGQRSERKKWIHCFEGVTAILFIVAINEYDMRLSEDQEMNRMVESMNLFGSVGQLQWFRSTSIILFLNKKDLFEMKIQHTPLTVCFPEYTGRNTYEEATRYIQERFEGLARKSGTPVVYTQFTCATDTDNTQLVFEATSDVIIRSHFVDMGSKF